VCVRVTDADQLAGKKGFGDSIVEKIRVSE
jgi:DNA uptake protein ComE-like DNA-binding protein